MTAAKACLTFEIHVAECSASQNNHVNCVAWAVVFRLEAACQANL